MSHRFRIGIHLVAVEEQMLALPEYDLVVTEEWSCCEDRTAAMSELISRRVDFIGSFAEQAEEHSAVSAVANSGERERAVEFDGDRGGCRKQTAVNEGPNEPQGGAHGADCMRT